MGQWIHGERERDYNTLHTFTCPDLSDPQGDGTGSSQEEVFIWCQTEGCLSETGSPHMKR